VKNKNVVFFGTSEFAAIILREIIKNFKVDLVITRKDKKGKRGSELFQSPVKKVAIDLNIPLLDTEYLDDIYTELKNNEYDFFIVASYGKILPQNIINLPKEKTLNVHASLLPKYRGASPIQAAIIDGESITGNTIIEITPKMDAGPILSQSKVKIDTTDNTPILTQKLALDGANLLIKTLNNLPQITPTLQEEKKATYTKIITKNDGHLSWEKENEITILNKIRALAHNPGTYSYLNENKINFYEATFTDYIARPGILTTKNNQLIIGTKEKSLQILSLKIAGKKIISGTDFINGFAHLLDKKLS
jgi:methionyl-tRNA formyltransferase